MDRPGVREVPGDGGKQRKMEETGCEVMVGAQTTSAVKKYVMVKVILKWIELLMVLVQRHQLRKQVQAAQVYCHLCHPLWL